MGKEPAVFVVLVRDRHCDPEVKVFLHEEKAIAYAEETAKDSCAHLEDLDLNYELDRHMIRAGWIRYIPYSCEDDSVTVTRQKVDCGL